MEIEWEDNLPDRATGEVLDMIAANAGLVRGHGEPDGLLRDRLIQLARQMLCSAAPIDPETIKQCMHKDRCSTGNIWLPTTWEGLTEDEILARFEARQQHSEGFQTIKNHMAWLDLETKTFVKSETTRTALWPEHLKLTPLQLDRARNLWADKLRALRATRNKAKNTTYVQSLSGSGRLRCSRRRQPRFQEQITLDKPKRDR